jgi:outer membrane lipoprotein-sorting protein
VKTFFNPKTFSTRIFCLLLVAFCLSATHSYSQQPKETIDQKAKKILDDLAAKTKSYSSIKAEFVSVIEKQGNNKDSKVTETLSGTLQVKGEKFRLEFKGQIIFCDSKTQWTYIKESNEVQINNPPDSKATDNINPANIFTLYEKGYKYKYDKEEVIDASKTDVVNLYPMDPDKKSYHTIKLFIDRTKNQIKSVKILFKNGTSNTITVKNFSANADMPDSVFIFNPADYKGVEVIDLREN